MYTKFSVLGLVVLAVLLATAPADAALVRADFNDLSLGDLSGQAGGVGLAGTWADNGTGNIDVVSGDLAAPASTNFAVDQSGSARSVQGVGTSDGDRGKRTFSTPLAGEVWFSFLVNPTATGRGGIDLDALRILAVGTGFRVLGATGVDKNVGGLFTPGSDALVLGRVQIDAGGGGEDYIQGWVNPDIYNLGTPAISVTTANWIGDGQLNTLGVESYFSGSAPAATVDLISVSDGGGNPNWAFNQVVGIPEPATLLIWSLLVGLGVGLGWRRRA